MRPIDADAMKNDVIYQVAFLSLLGGKVADFAEILKKGIVEEIEKAPTIDAAPVVHGKWVVVPDEVFADSYLCSVCRNEPIVDLYGEYCLSNYCPNCGAKMDGGKDNE